MDSGVQGVSYLIVACAYLDIMRWVSTPRVRRNWRARMPYMAPVAPVMPIIRRLCLRPLGGWGRW